LALSDYNTVFPCLSDSSLCESIFELIESSFHIAFYSLKPKQDEVSLRSYNRLISASGSKGNTLYLILGLCTIIILLMAGIISFMVIRIIRDKCGIFHIFSAIPFEDANKMANMYKRLNVKDVEFERKSFGETSAEVFWTRFLQVKDEEEIKVIEVLNESQPDLNQTLDRSSISARYNNTSFMSAIEYLFTLLLAPN